MVWDSSRSNFDRNLAVVIGIDLYKNHPAIRNLSTAESDARAIADLLERDYAYKPSEVLRLFDKEATLAGIRDLLHQRLPEDLKPGKGDRLIVYFAGHGLPRSNEDGPEGYLVPHDADPTEPESFLAMREVSEAFNKLDCHHLLIILDCCFAGTFRWAGNRKAIPILETIHREHYDHFIRYPAWHVITSSAHDQEALDVARLKEDNRKSVPGLQQPHSPFALALLEGLQPGDDPQRVKADLFPDGVVTAHELFVYLQNRVKELSGKQQAPGIYPLRRDYDRGEFVFTPPNFDPQSLAEALPLNEENNPYRGLKPFDEKHARFFFGRQVLIEELARRLSELNQALIVVLGVSGSGKSSLVKAGLIPYLRNQNTEQWRILDPMRPGELPFSSLARMLLPIAHENLLERLVQVSFLDDIFQAMGLKTESNNANSGEKKDNFVVVQSAQKIDETLLKVADFWCSATPEAKLLLIEDYFTQLEKLGNPQQQDHLKNLHDRILAALDSISKNLQQNLHWFSQVIATWSQNHPGVRLLLVIDQFEELLTSSQDDRKSPDQTKEQEDRSTEQKEWQKFLEVLRIAIAEHPQILRLVVTLRSDFEPRFLSSALEPYWKEARYPVRAMTSDELRQAIENPALKQALYFEELKDSKGNLIGNLVSKLVDEVGQMPGALPLLSFTLSELYVSLYKRWQADPKNTDRTLRFADYEALGGVAGALTRRATEEYDVLDEQHQTTMRRVMLRMVAIEGEGVARRRIPESELVYSNPKENKRVELVINCLVDARLLVKGQETGEPYVEAAHDFLVYGWDRLQEWIRIEKENLNLQQRLTPAATDWSKNNGDLEYLWIRDPRLSVLEKILESETNNWLNHLEAAFVEQSKQKRLDELEETRRQLRISEDRRKNALARQLAAQAQLMQREDVNQDQAIPIERSILLAIESLKLLPSVEADQVLRQALLRLPQTIKLSCIKSWDQEFLPFSFTADDGHIAVITADSSIKVFNCTTGEQKRQISDSQHATILSLSKSANYAALMESNKIRVLDLNNSDKSFSIRPKIQSIVGLSFSPDNQFVIALSKDQLSQTWRIHESAGIRPVILSKSGAVPVFSPNGKYWAEVSQNKLQVHETVSGEIIFSVTDLVSGQPSEQLLKYQQNGYVNASMTSMSFSADGSYFVAANQGYCLIKVWELPSGRELLFIEREAFLERVALSPDGNYLGAIFRKGFPIIWHTSSNQEILRLTDNLNAERLVFSPDSKLVATAGEGVCRVYQIPDTRAVVHKVFTGYVIRLEFSPNGTYLVVEEIPLDSHSSENDENTINVIKLSGENNDIPEPEWKTLLPQLQQKWKDKYIVNFFKDKINQHFDATCYTTLQAAIYAGEQVAALSPNGEFLTTVAENSTKLWNLAQDQCVLSVDHRAKEIAFSSDNQFLVMLHYEDLRIWRIPSYEEVEFSAFSQSETVEQYTAAINYSGELLANLKKDTQSGSQSLIIQEIGGSTLQSFALKHPSLGSDSTRRQCIFSPDGKYVAAFGATYSATGARSLAGTLQAWNLSTGEELIYITNERGVIDAVFSQNSKFLAAVIHNGTARIWNLDLLREIAQIAPEAGWLNFVEFSPDSKYLVSIDRSSKWVRWLFQSEDLIEQACNVLTRNLTKAEWQEYLGEEPYCKTCSTLSDS